MNTDFMPFLNKLVEGKISYKNPEYQKVLKELWEENNG